MSLTGCVLVSFFLTCGPILYLSDSSVLLQDGGVDEILRRQLDGLRIEASARVKNEAVLREEIKRLKRR